MKLTTNQMQAAHVIMAANRMQQTAWGYTTMRDTKHNHYYDFGYPSEVTFEQAYETYRRNGIAKAAIEKTIAKTWETMPCILEDEKQHDETGHEKEIRKRFQKLRFWQALKEADRRSMVGKYAGLVFRFADNTPMDKPVNSVGGLDRLIEVIPAWEGQLIPTAWDTDAMSNTYGQPTMYQYNESAVDPETGKMRQFLVHPDRCYIWSKDGTTFGESELTAAYNALMDLEKIRGAGGEGFWKNAKSQPILQADGDVDFSQLAAMLGTDISGVPDALDEVVGKWSKGFDVSMVLQGMDAKTLQVTLPNPKEFRDGCLMEIAASFCLPVKELTGNQTGERASSEDADAWANHNMARRDNMVVPNIMDIIDRLERFKVIQAADWFVDWADLTEASASDKIDRAGKMADINSKMMATGGVVFTDDEIREAAEYGPLEEDGLDETVDDDLYGDDDGDDV